MIACDQCRRASLRMPMGWWCTKCQRMVILQFKTDEERDAYFAPGNDLIWGEGNWIRCSVCPHDAADHEVYHHKDAHILP